MRLFGASLALAILSFQGACSTSVEPIQEKPVVYLEKGGFGGPFAKAELFEDNRLQRSTRADFDEETTFQVEQLREGAFTAARDYLLKNPVPANPDDLILECETYTIVEYAAIDGVNVKYSSSCPHQLLEDHYRNLEEIILSFSNKYYKGDLFP